MTESTHDNKRLAKNTLALFVRMAALMVISLYTSRVILQALGVTDFGIYNVVGGFVAMFSILNSMFSSSISRFITMAIGRGDETETAKVFCTSVNVIYIICAILFVALESFGLWFVNTHLNIPPERLTAANWVFQLSVLTFLIDIMAMPYNALIISHERMTAFAYIGIYEALGKLGISFLVMLSPIDRLVFYALLLAVFAVSVRIIYAVYCRRNFSESRYRLLIDWPLTKEMFAFSGWNFFGISSSMLADQGVNMVLNIFCGPVVNAARGIALQVSSGVGSFCGSFTSAINPQIYKTYAAGEREAYLRLCDRSARYSFFLYFLVALPVFLTAPLLLKVWLGSVPDHTVNFVRLVIIASLVNLLSNPLIVLIMATGDVKRLQLSVGGFRFIVVPVCWLLLYLGYQPEAVFTATIGVEIVGLLLRLLCLNIQIGFPVHLFIYKVVGRVIVVAMLSAFLPLLVSEVITIQWINFVVVCIMSLVCTSLVVCFIGMDFAERCFFIDKAKGIKKKFL